LTNAFWSVAGYAAAVVLVMLPVGGMVLLTAEGTEAEN
jgi:hypothetical protein